LQRRLQYYTQIIDKRNKIDQNLVNTNDALLGPIALLLEGNNSPFTTNESLINTAESLKKQQDSQLREIQELKYEQEVLLTSIQTARQKLQDIAPINNSQLIIAPQALLQAQKQLEATLGSFTSLISLVTKDLETKKKMLQVSTNETKNRNHWIENLS